MRHANFAALALAALMLLGSLSGCGDTPAQSSGTPASAPSAAEAPEVSVREPDSSAEESEDPNTAEILLCGDHIEASGGATVDGTTVTLIKPLVYNISGTLEDGQIIVRISKKEQAVLCLNGANITCTRGSPIVVEQADMVLIELAAGTENTVADTKDYSFAPGKDEPDAAIFSKEDLIFDGGGSLTVHGNYDMGIHGKDDLTFRGGGTYEIASVGDGIKGKDSVKIESAALRVTAGGDGIQSTNDVDPGQGSISIAGGDAFETSVTIDAQGDGIQAANTVTISGGTIDITAGEDGIKADHLQEQLPLEISGGTVTVDAQQDGIQAERTLSISGGTVSVTTSGGSGAAPEHRSEGFGPPPGWDWMGTNQEEKVSAKALKSATEILLSGGEIQLDAYDDAVHSDGTLTISEGCVLTLSTGDDGLHATEMVSITGGDILIEKSYEGIEGLKIDISGGNIDLTASDDGMNANGQEMFGPHFGGSGTEITLENSESYLHITGGYILVDSAGDGLDSNGLLLVEGGEAYVSGPSNSMNGALDSGTGARITGGRVIAAGASGMAESFDSDSTQNSIRYTFSQSIPGNTPISLTDSSGNELLGCTFEGAAEKSYNCVVLSCPELTIGETYTITCGENTVTVELENVVTYAGSSGGFGPGGGGPGGGGPGGPPPGF